MIKKEDLSEIGKFQKTHALRGELNAILDIDEAYVEDGNPLIVEMDGILVPFYAESIRSKGVTSFLIKLKGVDNIDDASEMVNKEIYALKGELSDYIDENMMLQQDLIGYEVSDEKYGILGKLLHIEDSTQNELLVVGTESGEDLYIPLVDDFILGIDQEYRIIHTSVPKDILELNQSKE